MQHEITSYKSVVDSYIRNLPAFKKGLLNPAEISFIRASINEMFALHGIITYNSLKDGRKKPYANSPYGRFVNRDNEGKHIDSFILSEEGEKKISSLLEQYIPDGVLYNKNIKGRKEMEYQIQREVSEETLICWMESNKIEYYRAKNGQDIYFKYHKKSYTFYKESNNIVTKDYWNSVFYFLLDILAPIPDSDSIRGAVEQIYTAYYQLKFTGTSDIFKLESSSKDDEMMRLKKEMEDMKQKMDILLSANTEKEKQISLIQTTSEIKDSIRNLAHSLPKRPYLASIINFDTAATEFERQKLKEAYNYLESRNLIDAVNSPEWKYNFNTESIELLCRIDKHASAVYDVRHRYIKPLLLADGTRLKEKADKEESEDKKFKLPFGLERINYRNKNIFIVEGIFDGCFIKNSLAITTAIMPHDMRQVVDIFRQNGFKIIHVPDNFRAGDKGGKAALSQYLKKDSDIFREGDLVFNWELWPDLKDINEVAMHHGWTEVSPKKILSYTWDYNSISEASVFIDNI